eukprot:GHVR01171721.1.p1 GENE.GHVR01171721.1~~GHVR01171721.1.p1  ORF type:complete len:108 (+),score=26.09 GHVR01171721.1:39-362(+)
MAGTGREITPIAKDAFWKACVVNEAAALPRWAVMWGDLLTTPDRRIVADTEEQRKNIENTLEEIRNSGSGMTYMKSEMKSALTIRPSLELFGVAQAYKRRDPDIHIG